MTVSMTTPAATGFSMPAEWAPHDGCLMVWPTRTALWGDQLLAAKRDYAAVAKAIARFEPVFLVCPPEFSAEAAAACGAGVEIIELPVDDSWARDSGPIFVRNEVTGEFGVMDFRFNAWGERWPHAEDAQLAQRLAVHFGLPCFRTSFVLEGGAFLVDGQGTVYVTEQCLLNPNRNPELTREEIEVQLKAGLGVDRVIWLPFGHALDTGPAGTDGHIDGVAQLVGPGRILLEVPSDPESTEYDRSRANRAALAAGPDAQGREIEVVELDVPVGSRVAYANHYLANGAVIVPVGGDEHDAPMLAALARIYPEREIVGVPGATIGEGGGGPHCITQQIPAGVLGVTHR
ncbi:agmatine deiminase family protein [Brevibacterium casei]